MRFSPSFLMIVTSSLPCWWDHDQKIFWWTSFHCINLSGLNLVGIRVTKLWNASLVHLTSSSMSQGLSRDHSVKNFAFLFETDRITQDRSDNGASKEPKNPWQDEFYAWAPLDNEPSELGFICLEKKRKIRFRFKESNRGFNPLNVNVWSAHCCYKRKQSSGIDI